MIFQRTRHLTYAVSVLFGLAIACHANLSERLVAYYPFDGNADDASQNRLHGGVYGALLTEGCFQTRNMAYLFDGEDDYIDAGYSELFNLDGDASVSMWVKRSGHGILFSIEGGRGYGGEQLNDNAVVCLTASPTGDGRLKYIHEYGHGQNQECFFDVIPANEWVHIAVTRDSSERRVRAFINGDLAGAYHYMFQPENPQAMLNLTMGSRSLGDAVFKGAMDEVMLFDRALDAEEVRVLWDNPKMRLMDLPANLVAYYPCDGNADDASPNGLHGGVFGALLTEGCFQRQNTAYLFDGRDDYVDAGYSEVWKLDEDVSVSMWLKRSGYGVLFSLEGGGGYGGEQVDENSVVCLTASPTGDGRLKYIHEYEHGRNQEHFFDVIPANEWVHVAVTRDSSTRRVKAFINGDLAGVYHYMFQPENPQAMLNLTIGSRSLGDQSFDGAMDEVMLFDRALDDYDVHWLMSR